MKYQLVMKNTGEIVTITGFEEFGLDEAKAYYVRMKQLKEKEFDKLYVVEEYKRPPVHREIKWWRDETDYLDIEKS